MRSRVKHVSVWEVATFFLCILFSSIKTLGAWVKKKMPKHIFLLSPNKQNLYTCHDLKITQNMAELMKKEYIKKKWQLPKQKHVLPDFI
jgi:hypothetical protein